MIRKQEIEDEGLLLSARYIVILVSPFCRILSLNDVQHGLSYLIVQSRSYHT